LSRKFFDQPCSSPLAGLHTLGLLCWPDKVDQEQRLIAARNWLRRCYDIRMTEVTEKALLHLLDEREALDLRQALSILNVSVDPAEFFAPFALASDEGGTAEDGFWRFLGVSPGFHRLRPEPPLWQATRFKPGDLPDDLHEYGFANALDHTIVQDPMLAGLGLLFVAAAKRSPSGRFGSLNGAWKIINQQKVLSRDWESTSLFKVWSAWCPMSPLWAGILAEARCWDGGKLRDLTKLEAAVIQTISIKTQRDRAYAYAKWFVTEIAPKRAVGSKIPLIATDIIIRLSETIVALAPDLSGAIPGN
jgi:hypothetical protein